MTSLLLRLRRAALRSLFAFIYGPGATLYDFVAWSSSAGQWRTWQQAALETLPEDRLLEIGHGPGHLLLQVRSAGRFVVGVDFSHQMTRMAARRLRREGWAACVVRARAQQLPFRSQAFNAAYSTFPSEYILEPASASEAARVVKPGGRIVVVPGVADITGRSMFDRLARGLYRVAGESVGSTQGWDRAMNELASRLGLHFRAESVAQDKAVVLRLVLDKPVGRRNHARDG
ncbi:MAG TPA: methyltransferase domain-containing protein [Anaerolineales bacterium]|nr:methyltransferase domain-containing protein [Anaerolineales bacterium]